jgi:DNA-binding transcriptional MerR regulator
MKTNLLSSADILEVTGLTPKQLQIWCEVGVVQPQGGNGRGDHRRFTVMQTLALSYARLWSMSGATTPLLRSVVEFITGFTEDELLAEFKAGRKLLIVVPGGKASLQKPRKNDPFDYWLLDIEQQYKRVLELIEEIENRPHRNVRGRSRGLITNEVAMTA